jgi:hypothetical protein
MIDVPQIMRFGNHRHQRCPQNDAHSPTLLEDHCTSPTAAHAKEVDVCIQLLSRIQEVASRNMHNCEIRTEMCEGRDHDYSKSSLGENRGYVYLRMQHQKIRNEPLSVGHHRDGDDEAHSPIPLGRQLETTKWTGLKPLQLSNIQAVSHNDDTVLNSEPHFMGRVACIDG